VDFPREGNGWSYQHARRQWSLADNKDLRYVGMERFDQAMQRLDARFHILEDELIQELAVEEPARRIVFRRGPLVFAFNFHPTESYFGLRIPVPDPENYRVVLDTDRLEFEGFGRNDDNALHFKEDEPYYGQRQSIRIYLPCRTAMVFAPESVVVAKPPQVR
jgi:1,4-alpha-glucan branching enzyme